EVHRGRVADTVRHRPHRPRDVHRPGLEGDRPAGTCRCRASPRPRDPDRDPGRCARDVRPPLPGRRGTALSLLIGDDFQQLFRSCEHTAFRLEVRESYSAPREVESFRRFKAGEPVDLSWAETWFSMIREATAAGRRFARVRVVNVPLSDYSRFGLWAARRTSE